MMRRASVAYAFLLPALLGLILFRIYPIAVSFLKSFYVRSFITKREVFVGLEGYQALFQDPIFWKSAWVTVLFNFVVNPVQMVAALGLALFLSVQVRGIHAFRSLYMLPIGISLPVAAVVWGVVLNPNSGLLNSLLALVGVPAQRFLTSPSQALWSIVLIASWKGVSYWMIFLLAGIKGIPETLYEAARIDGANAWQILTRVTIPLLRRVILFVVVADTISNYLLFIPAYLLTRGGPEHATNFLMYEAFKSGFIYLDMNRAVTIVSVLLVFLLLVIAVEFRFLKPQHEV
jgi:ABC-type sugar transport system permease subunit